MLWLNEQLDHLQKFILAGGDVLLVIFAVTFFMWALIIERFWYFKLSHALFVKEKLTEWHHRVDQQSWYALQIRRSLVSEVSLQIRRGLPTISTLISLCPLLGLLGTVTGMVQVFDVLSITGTGTPRAMAGGISKATIPTMAGMVAALSGIYFNDRLKKMAHKEIISFDKKLHES